MLDKLDMHGVEAVRVLALQAQGPQHLPAPAHQHHQLRADVGRDRDIVGIVVHVADEQGAVLAHGAPDHALADRQRVLRVAVDHLRRIADLAEQAQRLGGRVEQGQDAGSGPGHLHRPRHHQVDDPAQVEAGVELARDLLQRRQLGHAPGQRDVRALVEPRVLDDHRDLGGDGGEQVQVVLVVGALAVAVIDDHRPDHRRPNLQRHAQEGPRFQPRRVDAQRRQPR